MPPDPLELPAELWGLDTNQPSGQPGRLVHRLHHPADGHRDALVLFTTRDDAAAYAARVPDPPAEPAPLGDVAAVVGWMRAAGIGYVVIGLPGGGRRRALSLRRFLELAGVVDC